MPKVLPLGHLSKLGPCTYTPEELGVGGGGCPWQPLLHMCVELHFIRKKEDKEYKLIRILPIALRQL